MGEATWTERLDGSWTYGNDGYVFATVRGCRWWAYVPARDADLLDVAGPFEGEECSESQAKGEAEEACRRWAAGAEAWIRALRGDGG